ncbi:MAG: hypothetical protein JNG89_18360 [Planctomycetaceae bacterium]|nr:hypothetical protein [Planctomycetaceae bacterium]
MSASETAVASTKPKMMWYDQVWLALPFGLIILGGLIGGAIGGGAWAVNRVVFEKTATPVLRYVFTGLITGAAYLFWLVLAVILVMLLNQNQ